MAEQVHIWKTGDDVMIDCDGRFVPGTVILASPNGVSLMLGFEAILADHVGMMPVFRHDDGVFRSVANGASVRLFSPPEQQRGSDG